MLDRPSGADGRQHAVGLGRTVLVLDAVKERIHR